MSHTPHRGLIAPNLTPFNDDLSVATDLYVAHAQRLLEESCVALAPFGTTGEALSVSTSERLAAIQALITAGIDPAKLIPGTGLTDIPSTADFSRACLDLGCAAVMMLPPFYYKGVPDEGLYRYYAEVIERIDHPDLRIYLYHIPQVAGVGLSLDLVARLRRDFPDQIVGIKDSSGDNANTMGLLEIDGLVVYPGSELPILETTPKGAPGCISATANLAGKGIAQVLEHLFADRSEAAAEAFEAVRQVRLAFQEYAPIPSQKRLLAMMTGDERWANVRPPLLEMPAEKGAELQTVLNRYQ